MSSKDQFSAKILADSVNACGNRLTTFELTYPRIIHSECLTHRVFSKNSASSRAIPIQKTLKAVFENPFVPFHWGENQAGMQADNVLDNETADNCCMEWLMAASEMIHRVENLHEMGLHKQIANRLLEPFMYITVVLSTTSFKHFELLRNHPAAEPHFQYLAQLMVKARQDSVPELLQSGQWHLPLIYDEDRAALSLDDLKKVSVARCAAVSYVRHNERKEYDKDIALHDRLTSSGHWSPTEHVATPIYDSEWTGPFHEAIRFIPVQSGNFYGWKQYRKEFEAEFVPDDLYTGPTR
jgi:thymidylate synthase ThyX